MNTITSKIGMLARYLMLLAMLSVALSPCCVCAGDSVPFKGNAQGAIVGAVPDPGGLLLSILAEGNATHLGRFSREEAVHFNPATGAISGTVVFTAANGDKLCGTLTGQFTSLTTVAGTYTFTGGTGRFANATGEADFSLITPDSVHFTVEFAGHLSSVGASK